MASAKDDFEWFARQALWAATSYTVICIGIVIWLEVWRALLPWVGANEKLAGWAQALGGFVAIIATAIVAFTQSRHSQRQLETQISLQISALNHAEEQAQRRAAELRAAALDGVIAAYEILRRLAVFIDRRLIARPVIYDAWKEDLNWAKSNISKIE